MPDIDVVVVLLGFGQSVAGLPEAVGRLVGGIVRAHHLFPHSVLDEDMGGHVEGVGRIGRDLRVAIGSLQGQRRVNRIVEGVDDVVGRPGVVRVLAEDLAGDGAGAHAAAEIVVPVDADGPEEGDRVEGLHFIVVRKGIGVAAHRVAISEHALRFAALAEERFDRGRKPRSRAVGAAAKRASGLAPRRASTARGSSTSRSAMSGWLWLSASPQYAIANWGSSVEAARNSASAFSKVKLWR